MSYVAAADAAARIYAFGDAGQFLQSALELWNQVSDPAVRAGRSRADLLSQAAEFIALAGEFDRATALARATLSEPEIAAHGERRAEVWRRIAWYRLMASDGPGIFGAYESAAAALESAPETHAAGLVWRQRMRWLGPSGGAVWKHWHRPTARLPSPMPRGIWAARGLALNARGCVRSAAGESDDAARDLEQALDLARSQGTHQDVSRATLNLAATLVCAGRYEEGLALCEIGIDEATSVGLALPYAMICRNTAADALFALGRWPEAVSQVDAVLVLIDVGESARMAKGIRARIAVARGDPDLARRLLSEIPRQGRERDEPQLVAPACLALAELCAWSDLFEEGRAAVGAGLDLVAGTDASLTAQLCAIGMRLEADRCFSARRRRARSEETAARQRAREIAAAAEAVGVQEGTTGAWLDQAGAEFARIAGGDTDIPQFERWAAVRDRWRALGHRCGQAYAEVRWSEAKLSAGSRRDAETALRRSASVADELGAAPLAALWPASVCAAASTRCQLWPRMG
jgi:tetratricopeptide (TPR) repeat protein